MRRVAGIFGENSVRATPLPKAHASYSSIEGGERASLLRHPRQHPAAPPSPARMRPERSSHRPTETTAAFSPGKCSRFLPCVALPCAPGIFGEPAARPITPRESITKSSIEGGVFGGQPAEAENMIPTARAKCSMDAPSKEH
eukprot:5729504-Prymnesium_polylepis.1